MYSKLVHKLVNLQQRLQDNFQEEFNVHHYLEKMKFLMKVKEILIKVLLNLD